MNSLHVHLAFAPRGPGLLYAVAWRTHADRVLGWFIRPAQRGALAGYFMMPRDYAAGDAALLRSLSTDVQGDWVELHGDRERPLDHIPVPLSLRRPLTRLHDAFVRHWLFFERDPDAFLEAQALRALGIPLRHANVRAARLDQFQPMPGVLRYQSPAADVGVPMHLSMRLPRDPDSGASSRPVHVARSPLRSQDISPRCELDVPRAALGEIDEAPAIRAGRYAFSG